MVDEWAVVVQSAAVVQVVAVVEDPVADFALAFETVPLPVNRNCSNFHSDSSCSYLQKSQKIIIKIYH